MQGSVLRLVDPGLVYGAGGAERGLVPHVSVAVSRTLGVLGERVRGALHEIRESEGIGDNTQYISAIYYGCTPGAFLARAYKGMASI